MGKTGGLTELARSEVTQLVRLDGFGPARAFQLKAAVELGRRMAVPAPSRNKAIASAADVADWFRCRLQDRERECIYALLLDSKHRPLKTIRVTEGTWNSCPVDPKVVFAACLRHGAPAVILVHNHPSGDPTPSRDDLELTDRMARAGRVVGITLLDHLIVGRGGFTSLADSGLL
jgi:DNA repair protein RadC